MGPQTTTNQVALQVLADIYLDVHCAALDKTMQSRRWETRREIQPSLSPHIQPSPESGPPSNNLFVDNAIDAMTLARQGLRFESSSSSNLRQDRYVEFAKEFKYMLPSICGVSQAFKKAAQADDGLWEAVCELIRENTVSIELFAKSQRLDWLAPIPPDLRQQCGEVLDFDHDSYPRAIALDGTIFIPKYKGEEQVNLDYRLWNRNRRLDLPPLCRLKDDGACVLCGSFELCHCTLCLDKPPFVELREYPHRGIGVRCLQPIKKDTIIGEYLGVIIKDPCKDSTYALDHVVQMDEVRREICIINSAAYGNWTRYMNHSCRPSAIFTCVPVGKRVRALVRTIEDIGMFEEITVDYGGNYFSENGRNCLCGEETCKFRKGDRIMGSSK